MAEEADLIPFFQVFFDVFANSFRCDLVFSQSEMIE